jgi:predicted dehydrogenase
MSLRFAIVGCGAISEEMHIPALLACPDVELVAAVDADRKHAEQVAEKYGIKEALPDIADASSAIDAVVICTPPNVRPALVAQAFSLGFNVLAEKPLANSSAECEEIVALQRKSGRTLAVSHMFRFYPVRSQLHAIVASHGLGKIQSVEIKEGAPYAWNPRSGYTFKRGEVSGGVLINAGIHSLDSFIQWFGDPTIDQYEDDSLGGLESNARANLNFASGVTASFRISRTCRLPSVFRVACEGGSIVFSNRDTVAYRLEVAGATSLHRCAVAAQTPADCWQLQLGDFVASIREGRRPQVDGAEASRVVALVEDMYRMKQERPMPLTAPSPGATW